VSTLVGIAKLAAQSPLLAEKKRVDYFELETRSFLARCDSERVPFGWMINPYRGCEFGCKYCYARYAHEFMELRDPLDFERKIYVKQFDEARFMGELRRVPLGESIAIGTATDPYQPAERRFGVTRSILTAFTRTSGFRLGITTKSDAVTRDVDLLREVSRRHFLTVSMTVTTLDEELARALEPLAPRPSLRVAAAKELARSGVRATVFCSPVLPLINDSEESLEAIACAAAEAGASGFGANVLFLKPCARAVFLPFLEERFPLLVRRYRERYDKEAYLRGDYPEKIKARVQRIRERHGFDRPRPQAEPADWPQTQMHLFT
jgi:DNA repair photolyase